MRVEVIKGLTTSIVKVTEENGVMAHIELSRSELLELQQKLMLASYDLQHIND